MASEASRRRERRAGPQARRGVRASTWSTSSGISPVMAGGSAETSSTALALADDDERGRLTAYLDRPRRRPRAAPAVGATRGGWPRCGAGWRARSSGWVMSCSVVEQVKQWSISSVLRIETDGPELYFKVPVRLPLFVDEAVVTREAGAAVPRLRPGAARASSQSMAGCCCRRSRSCSTTTSPLEIVAGRAAALRPAAAADQPELTDELLADGCLDRRLDVLERTDRAAAERPESPSAMLDDGEVAELRRLAPTLKAICRRLAECEHPADARPRRPAPRQRRPASTASSCTSTGRTRVSPIPSSTCSRCSGSRTRRSGRRCSTRTWSPGSRWRPPSGCARPPTSPLS